MSADQCHICASARLDMHVGYSRLHRVTSDCKPWPSGGRLATCRQCGCTQAICDGLWRAEINSIYDDYSIYYQGAGDEQKVFDSSSGQLLPRSEILVRSIRSFCCLDDKGVALDVGCGNGAFLKVFGAVLPDWELYGTEYNVKYKRTVEALPGVKRMFTGSVDQVTEKIDFLSLIHVLEHIENPKTLLNDVRNVMADDGMLFVELPSWSDNPFELLIADHATHFTVETASDLVARARFKLAFAGNSWITKEISLVGSAALPSEGASTSCITSDFDKVERVILWLEATADKMRNTAAASSCFGIFGTSIASTWLMGELGHPPDFFVDEDPARIGGRHFGVPVLAPSEVSPDAEVFVAQPPALAAKIAQRLQNVRGRYIVPADEEP